MNKIKELFGLKGQRNLLLVCLILAVIFLRKCDAVEPHDVAVYEQNIAALRDSIRTYDDKNGNLVYEKASLLTATKDLSKYNADLAMELESLREHPIVITKFQTVLVHDTLWVIPEIDSNNITYNADSTVKIVPFNWEYDTTYAVGNYHKISGRYIIEVDTNMSVNTDEFMITSDSIGLSFVTGITENDEGLLEIFIKSPYPGFRPTSIDGAVLDPSESDVLKKFFPPKRWGVGPYVGYGMYMDPVKMSVGHGFSVGISVQYDVLQWRRK